MLFQASPWTQSEQTVQKLQNHDDGKPKMIFVTFKESDRQANEKMAGMYQDILLNGNVHIKSFLVEDQKALIATEQTGVRQEIIDFLLSRPEVDYVTVDQKDYFPSGRSASVHSSTKRTRRTRRTRRRATEGSKGTGSSKSDL
jgi:hypothetical protein